MKTNHSVFELFDALIEQTQQRGGCPSVREISDASLAVSNFVAAYSEVRALAKDALLGAGMIPAFSLALAIKQADNALEVLEGRND